MEDFLQHFASVFILIPSLSSGFRPPALKAYTPNAHFFSAAIITMKRHCLALAVTTILGPVYAKDDCAPWTWKWNARVRDVPATAVVAAEPTPSAVVTPFANKSASVAPGDIVCRSWAQTYDNVGYWSCKELADKFGITLDKFWLLNPQLAPDCKGVKSNTEYCVAGCESSMKSLCEVCAGASFTTILTTGSPSALLSHRTTSLYRWVLRS